MNAKDRAQAELSEMPIFFEDLNLDQVVESITAVAEEYNLKPFYYYPIHSIETIHFRQAIFRDLEKANLNEAVKSFSEKMVIVRRYLELISKLHYRQHKEGWQIEAAYVYCDAVEKLNEDLSSIKISSQGFKEFRIYLHNYVSNALFQSYSSEVKQVKTKLESIQYDLIIKNNWVRVKKYENEIDYSQEVLKTFEKFKQGATKSYLHNLLESAGMNHVGARILDRVAKLFPEIFNEMAEFNRNHASFMDETISHFDLEIQFYMAYLDYISNIKKAG
ncbi:MAG: hypothetical protein JW704_00360 [Anaerolineaceae bacterium]|nr:hypothetical protein [Anaerolineaceae bacterium]MBN2676696.1 hypothetical protein [Anaerolineaceae bacterium]